MWSRLTLFLIVSVAVSYCDHKHAWDANKEYKYFIQSRTMTTLDKFQQASGIAMKGVLVVQAQTPNMLQAKVSKLQYARTKEQTSSQLCEFQNSQQSNEEYHDVSISKKPFEIMLTNGVIRNLKVDKDVPVWEVNLLKGIVNQLQIDTMGENRLRSRSDQMPDNKQQPFASFKVMEESVYGSCEVYYDIAPLSEGFVNNRPEMIPMSYLDENNKFIEIRKLKDYKKCKQHRSYKYNENNWLSDWPYNSLKSLHWPEDTVSQVTTNNMVISGELKRFTIQSSLMTNNILVKLNKQDVDDNSVGTVCSTMNLTLVERNSFSKPMQERMNQFVSIENLMYTYNNPFSESTKMESMTYDPNFNQNVQQDRLSEKQSSSSEETHNYQHGMSNSGSDRGNNGRSHDSSSDEVSRESFSSEDINTNMQPKPRLNEPPHNPLLPFFIGINGKNIQTSNKIDVMQSAANLAVQITEEMQNPNVQQEPGQTLEKFTILQKLLRTMNTNQLLELEQRAAKLSSPLVDVKTIEDVTRKIISQIGTGPALQAVVQWIENKKLNMDSMETAFIVSRIPKTIRTPTIEYIQEFYKLVSMPEVTNHHFLNVSAPLALADLIHNVQYDKRNYPVHSFGRMTVPNNMLEEYISYFAEQLRRAVQENNSPRIQTYIVALGHISHPKIISVFKPYLESKQMISKFQRMLMVTSLSPLANDFPKLVNSILFKIYSNIYEPDEIRVAAFNGLIKTNPPLSMLQRIAQFTNYDRSTQVNSAVITAINSLAKLKTLESQEIAYKARMARRLLKNTNLNHSFLNSMNHYENLVDKNNRVQRYYLELISGDLPKYVRFEANTERNYLNSNMELTFAVSNIKQLLQLYSQNYPENKQEDQKQTLVEKLVRMFDITPNHVDQLEGYFLTLNSHVNYLYPFDKNILQKMVKRLKDLTSKNELNMNYLLNHDKIISFPMESGLPFIYAVQSPIMTYVKTRNTQGETNNRSKTTKGAFDILYAQKVQNRFGFTTPFEHQQYIAGIDQDFHVQLPVEFKIEKQSTTNRDNIDLRLNLRSNSQSNPQVQNLHLIHKGTVPFLMRQDILNLQPLLIKNKNTQIGHTKTQEQQELSQQNVLLGEGLFNVVIESYQKTTEKRNLIDILKLLMFSNEKDIHRKIDVFLNNNAANNGIRLNIAHVKSDNTDNVVNQQLESQKLQLLTVTDNQPNSEARRKEFLTELSKNVQSANNHVWDIDIEYPTLQRQNRQILTVGLGHNKMAERYGVLFYWNLQSAKDKNIKNEALGTGLINLSQKTPLNLKQMINSEQRNNFEFVLQYGKKYTDGEKIHVRGDMMQSKDLKNMIKNSKIVKQCQRESEQGNKGLQACYKAIQFADRKNQIKFSIFDLHNKNKCVNSILNLLNNMYNVNVNKLRQTNNEKETVDIEAEISLDHGGVNVNISTSDISTSLFLSDPSEPQLLLQLPELLQQLTSKLKHLITSSSLELISKLELALESLLESILSFSSQRLSSELLSLEKQVYSTLGQVQQDMCTMDKNQVVTFDGKVYPLELNEYWRIIMIPIPNTKSDKTKIDTLPKNADVVLLVRENNNNKQVRFIFGDKELQLQKLLTNDIQVLINGEQVKLYKNQDKPDKQNYLPLYHNDEVYIEIYELPDKSLNINSDKYGIRVVYDGDSLQIQAGYRYHNGIRGLCGNWDSQPDNDFISPNNKCVVQKFEDFIALYTLADNDQQKYTKNTDKQFPCVQQTYYQRNVINDVEARRSLTTKDWNYYDDNTDNEYRTNGRHRENKNQPHNLSRDQNASEMENNQNLQKTPFIYRTMLDEKDDQLCFSVRPIPMCDQNSQPTETKLKKYAFYCTLKDESSEQLKNRILQGANPDLSQKPVSMTKVYKVPLACQAA